MLKANCARGLVLPLVFVGALVGACDHSTAERKASPESHALAASSSALAPAVPDAGSTKSKYVFSAADSKIEFVGSRAKGKHRGSFNSFSGTILVLNGRPEQSSVTVDVDLGSVQTDDPKLTSWLKSRAFFDVTQFPKARFVSNSVREGGDLAATNTVSGILELHGVSKPVDIPGTIHVRPDAVDVDAELPLGRAAFGLTQSGKARDQIDDAVVLNLTITAKRVAEP